MSSGILIFCKTNHSSPPSSSRILFHTNTLGWATVSTQSVGLRLELTRCIRRETYSNLNLVDTRLERIRAAQIMNRFYCFSFTSAHFHRQYRPFTNGSWCRPRLVSCFAFCVRTNRWSNSLPGDHQNIFRVL